MSCGRCLLLIGDDAGESAWVLGDLRQEFPEIRVTQVADPKAAAQALLGAGFDAVVADHRLRRAEFLAALHAAAGRSPSGPVIVWTAPDLEEIVVEPVPGLPGTLAFKAPARPGRLSAAVRMALEHAGQHRALKEAEGRYRDLFEGVPVGLYRTTPAGQILDVNAALVQMSGSPSREAVLASNAADFYVDAEDRRRWAALMDRHAVVRDFELRLRRWDGRAIWVRHSARAVRDERGGVRWYEGLLEDITERKQAEDRMRETNEMLRALIEASPLAIITSAPDGSVRLWNRAAERVFGWRADEVLGRPASFVPAEPQDEVRALWDRVLQGESFTAVELRRRRRDGSPIDLSLSLAPLYDEGGGVSGMVAVIADISDRRRREQALRQSEKLAEMGSLLAGVAHELNNPLAIIVGQASLLHQALEDDRQAGRAREIAKAGERCARIVRNFLALARQRPTERREVRFNQVVQEALELLAYPLRVDSVAVALDLSPEVPALWADPHLLHQVVVNLAMNAHQAMRETPRPRRLSVTTRYNSEARKVSLEMADTGPGIPPEIQARVFEPFFTTKSEGQGTGLGLSICRGIIEGHGGTIGLAGGPGQGTTFRFELPVECPPGELAAAPPAEGAPPIRGKAILVVDDEPVIAELLVELLGADGHQVDATTDGAQALARLREQSYDLVLSDVRMPELDGPDLYREATHLHPRLRRRFIFMTGDQVGHLTQKFLQETPIVNLSKPFSLQEIRDAVRRALRESETPH